MAESTSINFKSVNIDSCITEMDEVHSSFRWTIQKFTKLPQASGVPLLSEQFPSAKGQPAYWQLQIYPRGDCKEAEDSVSFYLCLKSSESSNIRAEYTVRLEDVCGNTIEGPLKSYHTFLEEKAGWGYENYVKRESLKEKLKQSKSDTFVIHCSVTVFSDCINKPGPSSQSSAKIFYDACLSQDFQSLLINESYTDFVIKIDEREFKVHKSVLHARSSVFAAMLDSNMAESKSSEVTLDDVDPDVFEKVLQFIYTGRLAIMDSDVLDILPVADKYNIVSLKEQCADVSTAKISSMNAVRTLIMADAHHLDSLKAVAVEFISKNTEVVSKTDEWNHLVSKYPKLTTELLLAANRVTKSN